MSLTYAPSSPVPAALTPTDTSKNGSAAGDYSTTSTTYVDVDAVNLGFTVSIPLGQKLRVHATAQVNQATANGGAYRLVDGATELDQYNMPDVIAEERKVNMLAEVIGDGASHTIKLQFLAGATGTTTMRNTTASKTPHMSFRLQQAN